MINLSELNDKQLEAVKETEGYVHCEKLKLLDLKERGVYA